ncbi:hypothetical protein MCA0085 [Methylococcus capsulatus str. Bath]|uniref:Ribosomal protein L7/L12 C-terminal domain-containing protein n=1 Tax=Methylococcus capsulatus (strain ATCC 33009 / NCIMB 11132 / Bath) TaxID=243233 RepID=Q60CM1_METCA|nr:hypothetical protein [Methylococcus capsulatus]AAU90749.1 hypothetical protein MCA0085 [Methylococcus capsulatus str. Bath]
MNEAAANLSGFPKEYAFLLLGTGLGFFLGWLVSRIGGPGRTAPGRTAGGAGIPSDAQPVDVVVNGKMVRLPSDTAAEIRRLIRDGNPGGAVNRLREVTGLRPAEAKAVIDSLARIAD